MFIYSVSEKTSRNESKKTIRNESEKTIRNESEVFHLKFECHLIVATLFVLDVAMDNLSSSIVYIETGIHLQR